MTGVNVTDRTVSYTSAFSEIATKDDFKVVVELPEGNDIDKIYLQTKEEYDELPVRLMSINAAMEFPAKVWVDVVEKSTQLGVTAGRNRANHPEDKMIQTQVTIQAVTEEGELLGEDVVTLNG